MAEKKPAAPRAPRPPKAAPGELEPVRDHFIHGVVGLFTADEAAAWWAAHPKGPESEPGLAPAPPPPAEADESPKAPETPGPSDSKE
jgi:hypothetical protein